MKEHISCHLSQSFKIAGTYIWLLLLAISLLQSCDDNDEVKNKPTLYIITEPIDGLSTYGGAVQVEFLCNLDWKASTDASWITLDETSGSQSATIDARIAKNEEGADRTGTITLVAGELKKTLSITQKYRDTSTPQLEITTKNPVKLGFEGGVQAISFVCNVRWEASVDVDWISFSNATSGLEDGTLDFVVDANEGDEIREGIITIVAQGLIKTVEIVQQTEAMGGVTLRKKITASKESLPTSFGLLWENGVARIRKVLVNLELTIPLSGFQQVLLHLAPGRHIYSYVCAITSKQLP